MQSLSLVIITKNEAKNLARCIESVPFADEIIVVDSQSTDQTREIARRYTEKVYDLPWKGFGPAKQAAMERATCDWILSLDADEELDDELAGSILNVLKQDSKTSAGYRVVRLSSFLGRWIRHSGWYPERIVRLGRRGAIACTPEPVHERLDVEGPVSDLKGHLLHHTAPEFNGYMKKIHLYADLMAQKKFKKGKRSGILHIYIRPLYKFWWAYLFKMGFRDGTQGLILAGSLAYYVYVQYARIWELRKAAERERAETDGDLN